LRVDSERRRIGLSLKRVDSAEYVELDWAAAVQDQSEEEPVMDFDAELEAEAELVALEEERVPEVPEDQEEVFTAGTENEG